MRDGPRARHGQGINRERGASDEPSAEVAKTVARFLE